MLICILTKNVITSCSVTMMLFLHLEVKPLMTLTTVLYLSCALIDRKSGSAGMPRPNSYAVFCLKKKRTISWQTHRPAQLSRGGDQNAGLPRDHDGPKCPIRQALA